MLSWSMSSCVYGLLSIVMHVSIYMLSSACDVAVFFMNEFMVCVADRVIALMTRLSQE